MHMQVQVPLVSGHNFVKAVLIGLNTMGEVGKSATSHFWLLKALAHLVDLHIYHPEDAAVAKARDALLPGETAYDVHILTSTSALSSHACASEAESAI